MIVDTMTHDEVYEELAREREAVTTGMQQHEFDTQRAKIMTDREMYDKAMMFYRK